MSEMTYFYNTLKEIYFCLDDGDRRFLSQYNLSVPRFFTLKYIGEQPGISPTELSVLMLSTKSNITRLIKGMESEGLVKRRPHTKDRRTICLYLTERGKSLVDEVSTRHASFNQERFSVLNDDLHALLDDLQEVKVVLEDQLGGLKI
jgi:DNA-binding MarR family transcriptional regulator